MEKDAIGMTMSDEEEIVYLIEQSMRSYFDRDCPLCRGAKCKVCHQTGMMKDIRDPDYHLKALPVMDSDANWLNIVLDEHGA